MSLRRSRFQIIIELLSAISQGEYRPTRLMYCCNLSWGTLRNMLSMLECKGYIDDMSGGEKRKHYCVTGAGQEVLGYYSGLEDLLHV